MRKFPTTKLKVSVRSKCKMQTKWPSGSGRACSKRARSWTSSSLSTWRICTQLRTLNSFKRSNYRPNSLAIPTPIPIRFSRELGLRLARREVTTVSSRTCNRKKIWQMLRMVLSFRMCRWIAETRQGSARMRRQSERLRVNKSSNCLLKSKMMFRCQCLLKAIRLRTRRVPSLIKSSTVNRSSC